MLELTRHTTLIDVATIYTPHFRCSEMARTNSLLLDGGDQGGVRRRNKKILYKNDLIEIDLFYFCNMTLTGWEGVGGVSVFLGGGVLTTLLEVPCGVPVCLAPTYPPHFFCKWCRSMWLGREGLRDQRSQPGNEEKKSGGDCLVHLLSCQALLASCSEGKWSLKPLVRNFSLVWTLFKFLKWVIPVINTLDFVRQIYLLKFKVWIWWIYAWECMGLECLLYVGSCSMSTRS